MAAVVDRRARFGRVVDRAEVLPFARSHLGAGLGGARRGVGEEGDEDVVGFLNEEAGEFVEPDLLGSVRGWMSELAGGGGRERDGVRGFRWMGVGPVEALQMFGQLKG